MYANGHHFCACMILNSFKKQKKDETRVFCRCSCECDPQIPIVLPPHSRLGQAGGSDEGRREERKVGRRRGPQPTLPECLQRRERRDQEGHEQIFCEPPHTLTCLSTVDLYSDCVGHSDCVGIIILPQECHILNGQT